MVWYGNGANGYSYISKNRYTRKGINSEYTRTVILCPVRDTCCHDIPVRAYQRTQKNPITGLVMGFLRDGFLCSQTTSRLAW